VIELRERDDVIMLKEAEDKYKEYLDENRKRTQSKVQE